ncbi:hypothetical protein OS493_032328 [Desmophyllum pertusum]|uniref:Uncharacterized protein n=1 Tax=Desmophyllum pertusum TaxID=174260 RepID=A0A9X0CQF6_9CNID|nr:hypothetical protein OS493_032328 [Desmophyllum pertusum]
MIVVMIYKERLNRKHFSSAEVKRGKNIPRNTQRKHLIPAICSSEFANQRAEEWTKKEAKNLGENPRIQ